MQKLLDASSLVVEKYNEFLAARPLSAGSYRDISELPFPKDVVLRAIRIILAREQGQIESQLHFLGFTLAQFQPDVGPTDLCAVPFSQAELNGLSDDVLLARLAGHQHIYERWATFSESYELELRMIGVLLRQPLDR